MAKMPNADQAIVEERKITGYPLSDTHPVGAPKAAFFKNFGFGSDNPEVLRDALLAHALSQDVAVECAVPHGIIYEISGPLPAPDGRLPIVRTA